MRDEKFYSTPIEDNMHEDIPSDDKIAKLKMGPDTKKVAEEIEKYKRMQKLLEDKSNLRGSIIVCCVAIFCLTGLEGMAIYKGIDGKFFSLVTIIVGSIAGFKVKDIIGFFRGK